MTELPRSLPEFEARFPDKEACARWLLAKRWPDGFGCPACGHDRTLALNLDRTVTTRFLCSMLLGAAVAVSILAPTRRCAAAGGNILFIIADDMGKDAAWLSFTWPATTVPRAPQLDLQALANRGITFGNFDAHMECSPTRATYMTGQYAFRPQNGVAEWINESRVDLPAAAFTLYEAFAKSPAGQR